MTTETLFDTEDAYPLFTREERRKASRTHVRCGECDKVIREGGTTEVIELCASCADRLEV